MANWKKGLAGLALMLCMAPVASAAEVIINDGPTEAPPIVREEAPPYRRGYVWTGDHYEWRHHRYVRVHGRYVRERRGYDWAPGRWERHENRYQWHGGEWHPHR